VHRLRKHRMTPAVARRSDSTPFWTGRHSQVMGPAGVAPASRPAVAWASWPALAWCRVATISGASYSTEGAPVPRTWGPGITARDRTYRGQKLRPRDERPHAATGRILIPSAFITPTKVNSPGSPLGESALLSASPVTPACAARCDILRAHPAVVNSLVASFPRRPLKTSRKDFRQFCRLIPGNRQNEFSI
jgi:hypothetical protein